MIGDNKRKVKHKIEIGSNLAQVLIFLILVAGFIITALFVPVGVVKTIGLIAMCLVLLSLFM